MKCWYNMKKRAWLFSSAGAIEKVCFLFPPGGLLVCLCSRVCPATSVATLPLFVLLSLTLVFVFALFSWESPGCMMKYRGWGVGTQRAELGIKMLAM